MSERIVVFDIELLNNDPTSICSIGIVEMIDFEVVSTYYSLIKPRSLKYDSIRYHINHIKPDDLKQQPSFKEVWEEILPYFNKNIVVAHDINVDMLHLRETLKAENIPYPEVKMSCTNVLAHLLFPDLHKYNLTELAHLYNIEFECHHALEDAKVCAMILKNMVINDGEKTLKDLHMKYHLAFGEMKYNYYRNMISGDVLQNLRKLPVNEPLQSIVCFTGKFSLEKEVLEEKTREVNALPTHNVTTQTNILVIGNQGYRKIRYGKENKNVLKALKLIDEGQDLQIVSEDKYIKLLDEMAL